MPENEMSGNFERERWPFYWVSRTNGLYIKELEGELKKKNLDIPSWRALMLLGDGQARSVSYLALESVAKLSTMTRIVQRMKSEGLVHVRPRKSDARVTEAYLTPEGELARKTALGIARGVAGRAFEGVDEAEMTALISALSKVMVNLEKGKS